ncbi:uncharacterized protein MELLADRAFT_84861 [Melampsora larici-populina 98AG31]|uniref:Uncharacterized protein n=1 Tax=Melampsora larici-populina (strain 98AG31 / pathotype 3-4-7) TaxID=747676 RepID=F4SCR4_MELLP|nr:uncharacterized protein MELLADRAFT_84861 [Melampsora larici-populina 98AG31]EGF97563.1 hypothetical protein MELLADRAFT_84861 [Melampsora larici-populina 98AG31]
MPQQTHQRRNAYVFDEESSNDPNEPRTREREMHEPAQRTPSVTFLREGRQVVEKGARSGANGEGEEGWFHGSKSEEESNKAKSIMAAKKGSLTLSNGDMIHNGRVFRCGSAKMEDALTPLSPHLTRKLKALKSFIPLPVFDEDFLLKDQKAWSLLPPKSEDKVEKEKRMYGGEGPVEELTMNFEAWSDCMELFCVHLRAADWEPVAEKFEHYMTIVKKIRKDFGWMVALRYCRLVRQGVMRETIDGSLGNWAELQDHLLTQAKTKAESFNERAYKTNPYAEGGPKASICPYTNQPKPSSLKHVASTTAQSASNQASQAVNRHASTSSYRGNGNWKRYQGSYRDTYREPAREQYRGGDQRDTRGPKWGEGKRRERSRSPEKRYGRRGDGKWKRS